MRTSHSMLLTSLLTTAMLLGCETISQDFSALGESLSTPSPLQAAEMMFDKYNPDNRRRGTVLLANSDFGGGPVYVEAYRQMVSDERNPLVLAVAVRALAKHGESSDAAAIAAHLFHENRQVRWESAKGLQRLHDPRVVSDLLRSLGNESEDSDVRIAVADALAQYRQDRVFQGLVGALSARQLAVNVSAERALATLTDMRFEGDQRAWLSWYDEVIAAGQDPFAGAADYTYPTYARDRAWWEQLAFWTQPVREQPGYPAGLEPSDTRSTYDDQGDSSGNSDEAGSDELPHRSSTNS